MVPPARQSDGKPWLITRESRDSCRSGLVRLTRPSRSEGTAAISHSNDRAGLLYALAGFCTLSIGDAIVKSMTGLWPAPAMAATRYLVGSTILAAMLARAEGVSALRLPRDPIQW